MVLVLYNQCANPLDARKLVKTFSTTKFSVSNGDKFSFNDHSSSVHSEVIFQETFKSTLYTLTRSSCLSCHDLIQSPLLTSADVKVAYGSIINSNLIDFNDIAQSDIVLKLRNDHHHCWSDCENNANEIIEKIEEWVNLILIKTAQSESSLESTASEEINKGTIKLLANNSLLKAPMIEAKIDGISYIESPIDSDSENLMSTDDRLAYLEFNVFVSDNYKVFMYVDVPEESANTLSFKFDEKYVLQWKVEKTNGFEWRQYSLPNSVSLPISNKKEHSINVFNISKGLKISKIIFSNSPNIAEDLQTQNE